MTQPQPPDAQILTGDPAPPLDLPALYPACFDWTAPRPIKIGIFEDLREAGYSGKAIRWTLKRYCKSAAYLAAMREGVPRIDLQGQPVGEVTAPVAVKAGMKIGIQTETALVVATLPPKAWNKLEKAQADWPQWVASLTGKLGAKVGADGAGVVVLEQPALQVFEKKPKPAPEPNPGV